MNICAVRTILSSDVMKPAGLALKDNSLSHEPVTFGSNTSPTVYYVTNHIGLYERFYKCSYCGSLYAEEQP